MDEKAGGLDRVKTLDEVLSNAVDGPADEEQGRRIIQTKGRKI
jgi:hypothetical protein